MEYNILDSIDLNDKAIYKSFTERITLLCLAPSHFIFKRNDEYTLNFTVGKVDRLTNTVKGKGKKGGQMLTPNAAICQVEWSDGTRFEIPCGMKGTLVEINEELVKNPKLLKEYPDSNGFIAIMLSSISVSDSTKKDLLNHEEGFLLPVQYSDLSVSASHLFTRKNASIFDVSHMLQTNVYGKDCISWFESICPVDLNGMSHGTSSLTVFLNKNGGIIDDLIVTKVKEDQLYIVSNAGRLDVDKQHMLETSEIFRKNGKDVSVEMWDVTQRALIAVQGPKAMSILQTVTDIPLEGLTFMTSRIGAVAGIDCRVTRCGYTGEDGFEISIPADKAHHVTEALLQSQDIKLAGLGARDSLRLEAGLCLYGNDIDETITPVEAALTWLIAKGRRNSADFPGAEIILRQIKEGVSRRRVGIRMEGGAPARKDAILKNNTGKVIGKVTSGCPSPSLGGNVAMGYVTEELKKVGTELLVNIRGKNVQCKVAKMPFTPSKYYIKT